MRTGIVLSTAAEKSRTIRCKSIPPSAGAARPDPLRHGPRGLAGSAAAWPPRTAARRRRPRRSASRSAPDEGSRPAGRSSAATRGRSPLPSLPSTSTTLPGQVDLGVGSRRPGLGAVDPRARLLGRREPVGQVRDPRDREVLDRPRRGLAGGGRDRRRAPRRDHHPGGSGDLGRAADRPEVVGVLDLVQRHDQGVRRFEQRCADRRRGRDQPRPPSPDGRANQPAGRAPPAARPCVVNTRCTRRRPRWASATGRRP